MLKIWTITSNTREAKISYKGKLREDNGWVRPGKQLSALPMKGQPTQALQKCITYISTFRVASPFKMFVKKFVNIKKVCLMLPFLIAQLLEYGACPFICDSERAG